MLLSLFFSSSSLFFVYSSLPVSWYARHADSGQRNRGLRPVFYAQCHSNNGLGNARVNNYHKNKSTAMLKGELCLNTDISRAYTMDAVFLGGPIFVPQI